MIKIKYLGSIVKNAMILLKNSASTIRKCNETCS